MNSEMKNVFLAVSLAALALPAMGQTSNPGTQSAAQPPTINQRKENQQDRIANGVQSGELTAGETHNLENKEAGLNQEERDMRKLDQGHLTAADRATLNQQQNQLSNQIYRDKHNAAVQNTNPRSEVGKRAENQQDRIAQGIRSGQLSAGEAAHLQGHEAAVNHEIARDRAANGGQLTAGEKAQINRQQNRMSRNIYRDKHNGRKQ
jgi:hypothetical protein